MKFKYAVNVPLFSVMLLGACFCAVGNNGAPLKQDNRICNCTVSPLSGNSRGDFEMARIQVTDRLSAALHEKGNVHTNEMLDVLRLLGKLHMVDTNDFTKESLEAIRLDDALIANGEIDTPMVFIGRRNSPNIAKTRTRHRRMLDWNLAVLGYRTRLFDSIDQIVSLAQKEDREMMKDFLEEYVQLDFGDLQVHSKAVVVSDYWELATHIGGVLDGDSSSQEMSKMFLIRTISRFQVEIGKCKTVVTQGTRCGSSECDRLKLLRDYEQAKEYFFEKCEFKKYYAGLSAEEKSKWRRLIRDSIGDCVKWFDGN